jgi:serpin B
MRKRGLLLRVFFACSMISAGIDSAGHAQPAQARSLVEGNTAFALELYAQLKSTPGNLFFSPYSISTCLAMTYAGARGDTESQMARVFHFAKDQAQLHSSFGALQRELREASNQKGIELNIANALRAQSGHPFLPDFLNVARTQYEANVNQADFKTESAAATQKINQWVAEKTKDKIQNILPPGTLDASTRLVLANAIYFKGAWTRPFDKAQTTSQPFHLSAGKQVDVPLMHHEDDVKYTENAEFQAVELPYGSNQLSMVVLLPRQVDGCSQLESRLNPDLLSKTIADLRKRKVDIFLPRFKLESRFELNDPLSKLGMQDAFGSKADFSGMDGTRLLYISAVLHKAWGEVNEEGTEAAAATVVGMRALSAAIPAPPPVFRADHPFIFLIRDTRSGSVLFLGRLAEPGK